MLSFYIFFFCLAGDDFDDDMIILTFPIGASPTGGGNRQCGLISIVDDNLVEVTEFFTVQSTVPAGVVFTANTATVTIADNDGEFSCQWRWL